MVSGTVFVDTYAHDKWEEGGRETERIHLTNLDESAVKEWWGGFRNNNKWKTLSQNCSTTVHDALVAGGSNSHLLNYPDPSFGVWDPDSIAQYGRALRAVGSGHMVYSASKFDWGAR